ncbi:hypothetical protein M1D97_00235 [Kushneria sp. AK178]
MISSFSTASYLLPESRGVTTSVSEETYSRRSSTPAEPGSKSSDIHVDLSHLGKALSGKSGSESSREAKFEKIEKSSFSDQMKKIMSRIVELKEELEKKQQELQKIMQDQSLTPGQRQQRAGTLQSEISNLSSALRAAMGMLSDTMQQEGLESEEAVEVASLIL